MNPLAVIEVHIAEFPSARRVFGSFVRGEARDDSDVDVYVEFDDADEVLKSAFIRSLEIIGEASKKARR